MYTPLEEYMNMSAPQWAGVESYINQYKWGGKNYYYPWAYNVSPNFLVYNRGVFEQIGIEDIGGTLRLGAYPCVLDKTSKAYELYGEELIHERHRHRYEVNNDYRKVLTENGMMLSGISPDGRIVEMIEIKEHPWFLATQAHPELKSRPNRPHPLFRGFIGAALEYQEKNN